jgi:DNA primase
MSAPGEITLEAFKARLPLAQIVGRYVRLTRAGREHRGLCPFHKEKSPSFHVVEEKGFYHCFGCGAHGTAIDFMMAVERLEFAEAIERLAELTGLPAPRRRAENAQAAEAHAALYRANQAAAAWFQRQLEHERGHEALAYLTRRGVDRRLARSLGLGFAPDERLTLKRDLLAEGFKEEELLAAGLLATADEGRGASFDRFRARVMFPIADPQGRIVGFGGRALGEARAKYLNTPETEIFKKGELLYNLHRAAAPARQRRQILLVEGYMDVIALVRAGIPQAVAPLGTALTERQLQLLWRHADAPLICLDGDRAGLAAALRAAERALPLMEGNRSLAFALLPEGEDPDSFVGRHGAAAMEEVLGRAQTTSQLVWRLETQGRQFETPEARAGLRRRLRGYARLATDPDLRASLVAGFDELMEQAFPRRARSRFAPRDGRPLPARWEGVGAARLAAGLRVVPSFAEERLLAPLLHDPELLNGCEELVAELALADGDLARLRDEILLWFGDGGTLDANALAQHLQQHGLASVRERALAAVEGPEHLRGDTTAWPSASEWQAMLIGWQPLSAMRRHKTSFAESLLAGEAGEVAVSRSSLDRLLNRAAQGAVVEKAGPNDPDGEA